MAPAELACVRVEVCHAPVAREAHTVRLELPVGSTVGDALRASGLVLGEGSAALTVAVWGRSVEPTAPLRDRDRIELLRPLLVDPKEARRQRYQRQGGRRRAAAAR